MRTELRNRIARALRNLATRLDGVHDHRLVVVKLEPNGSGSSPQASSKSSMNARN
jgi:hypothetical protein